MCQADAGDGASAWMEAFDCIISSGLYLVWDHTYFQQKKKHLGNMPVCWNCNSGGMRTDHKSVYWSADSFVM